VIQHHIRFGTMTALVALAVAGIGCTTTQKPIVPAEGKITFADGQPLPKGTRVILNPSEGKVGTASGVTEEDGSFRLVHVSGSRGAEEGSYTVQVLAPEGGDTAAFYKMLPKDVADGNTFTAEIKTGMAPLVFKVPRARR
jgi:hypothetical protein